METHESIPLILFSGLAADAKVFAPQKIAFPQLVVPEWLAPRTAETLDVYCQRLAEGLRSKERPIIGGASFGGIVALHMARHLDPRAILLIGSVRSPKELPPYIRRAKCLRSWIRFIPVRMLQMGLAPVSSDSMRRSFPHMIGIVRQFRRSSPAVFRWSISRLLEWTEEPEVECPVFHIHGKRDRVFPARYTVPDQLIDRGGHVISLTHANEVNEFIRSAIDTIGNALTVPRESLG